MDRLSLEELADDFASDFAAAHHQITDELREELQEAVLVAVRRVARNERELCIAACLQRQAMWEKTEARSTISEPLRLEARARCNEAAVIADAMRVGGSAPDA
jgi:hypothetical protein